MTDQQLLALLESNPETGLEALMDQYMGLVYTIVSGKLLSLSSKEETEECASDVFYEIYKNRENIDLEKGAIKAYISVVAKRKAIDRYRKLSGKVFSTVSLDEPDFEQVFMAKDSSEDIAAADEIRTELIGHIMNLGEPDSEVFLRKYFLGQNTKEIAASIQIKTNTVDKKISRGLVKLRNAMGGIL